MTQAPDRTWFALPMRNGVGSITDLNVLSTQLLQAKKASTDVYSTALAGGGLSGVGDRLSPP